MTSVPRRLSVHDEGFDQAAAADLVIHLDGVKQANANAYDMDAGTVTRAKLDADGNLYCEGDEVAIETVHGCVEVARRT